MARFDKDMPLSERVFITLLANPWVRRSDQDADEDEAADEEPPAAVAPGDPSVLAAIERMLARSDIAETTREELEGYKDSLAEGEFAESDRAYLRALESRINKRT